jgi:hypothetical protein
VEKRNATKYFDARFIISLIVMLFSLLATSLAFASCGSGPVLYQDDFSGPDAWGITDDDPEVSLQNGAMLLKADPGYERYVLNQTDYYGDGTICVDMAFAKTRVDNETWGGLLFWGSDYKNFYAFVISGVGHFAVWRKSNGKWLTPIDWSPASSAGKAQGASNDLQVKLQGKKAIFLVNGKQVGSLTTGFPPSGGGLVGVMGSSPREATATLKFSNFVVEGDATNSH